MNHRNRDRVSAPIEGKGTDMENGAEFSFSAKDFSVMGMLIQVEGMTPKVGSNLRLEFQVEDPSTGELTISMEAEVMRITDDGGVGYGIRWLAEKGSRELNVLENYYMERFFAAME